MVYIITVFVTLSELGLVEYNPVLTINYYQKKRTTLCSLQCQTHILQHNN